MQNSASYILSAYSFIYELPPDKLLDVGYQSKYGNPIPSFDEDILIQLCSEAESIFMNDNNILEITGDIIIVGDIHGSLHDLLRILKFIEDKNSKVLFLGDYVDRGNFSLECITILYALKVTKPDQFFLLRGNHEFDSICSLYGFKEEIINYHIPKKPPTVTISDNGHLIKKSSSTSLLKKAHLDMDQYLLDRFNNTNCYQYTEKLYQSFVHSFSYLPIAAVINSTTFCIHGGLSSKLENVNQINTLIKRPIDRFEDDPLLSDLVWSDPSHSTHCLFEENPRGLGQLFNGESVANFLKTGSFTRMIRGHQCVSKGIEKLFKDKCITVFSASSYDKQVRNYSSILLLFEKSDTIQSQTFKPLKRLEKYDCFYFKVQSRCSPNDKTQFCFSLMHPKLISSARDRTVIGISCNRQIRSQRSDDSFNGFHSYSSRPRGSEGNLQGLQSFSSRPLNLVMPKFVTNQRISLNSFMVHHSFSSRDSSKSDYDDN